MIPDAWLDIARKQARANKAQPIVWYLIGLIRKDAEGAGETDFPAAPWDDKVDS